MTSPRRFTAPSRSPSVGTVHVLMRASVSAALLSCAPSIDEPPISASCDLADVEVVDRTGVATETMMRGARIGLARFLRWTGRNDVCADEIAFTTVWEDPTPNDGIRGEYPAFDWSGNRIELEVNEFGSAGSPYAYAANVTASLCQRLQSDPSFGVLVDPEVAMDEVHIPTARFDQIPTAELATAFVCAAGPPSPALDAIELACPIGWDRQSSRSLLSEAGLFDAVLPSEVLPPALAEVRIRAAEQPDSRWGGRAHTLAARWHGDGWMWFRGTEVAFWDDELRYAGAMALPEGRLYEFLGGGPAGVVLKWTRSRESGALLMRPDRTTTDLPIEFIPLQTGFSVDEDRLLWLEYDRPYGVNDVVSSVCVMNLDDPSVIDTYQVPGIQERLEWVVPTAGGWKVGSYDQQFVWDEEEEAWHTTSMPVNWADDVVPVGEHLLAHGRTYMPGGDPARRAWVLVDVDQRSWRVVNTACNDAVIPWWSAIDENTAGALVITEDGELEEHRLVLHPSE